MRLPKLLSSRFSSVRFSSVSRALNLAVALGEIAWSRLAAPKPRARLDAALQPEIRRIAVFAYMGLGDAIVALPFLRALRSAFPNAELTAICSRASAAHEVFTMSGLVENVEFFEFKTASLLDRKSVV